MKPLTIVSSGLLLFGAGFLAGHYERVITSDIATTKVETKDTVSYSATPKLIQNSPPNVVITQASNSKPAINKASVQQTSSKVLLPHELMLTAEAQSQLAAQQWEAKQAEIHQIDAMIQSMEDNGLPAEDIKNFREMKKAREEQLNEIPQASETPSTVRTEAELEKDFVASLNQAGVPPVERDKMLESFSPVEAIHNTANTELKPPHEQQQ